MNSFEINKILGAVLGTCLILLAVHIASGAIFAPRVPAKPGYVVAVTQEQTGAKTAAAPAEKPIGDLLAAASVERGAQVAKECQVCHNLQEGQGAKIGPDLYGVVGRKVASVPSFHYTSALKAKGGTWTFDALNKWLTNPQADVPGTAMTFAGIPRESQRAEVIAYLDTLSQHPEPLPTPKKESNAAPATASAATSQAAAPAGAAAPAKAPAQPSFESLVASAAVERGAQVAKQCEICHNVQKGQGAKIGPDLYGVVGRKVASVPGFNYSSALKAKGGTWTLDALNKWLTNPQADVPGTAMTFAGLSREKQRAEVVAFLKSLTEPTPQKAGAAAAPPEATPSAPPAAPKAQ